MTLSCPACGAEIIVRAVTRPPRAISPRTGRTRRETPGREEDWTPRSGPAQLRLDRPAGLQVRKEAIDAVNAVCAQVGISLSELRGPDRGQSIVQVRQAAMAAARDAGASLGETAHLLARDRSTVLHGVRAYRDRQQPESNPTKGAP